MKGLVLSFLGKEKDYIKLFSLSQIVHYLVNQKEKGNGPLWLVVSRRDKG